MACQILWYEQWAFQATMKTLYGLDNSGTTTQITVYLASQVTTIRVATVNYHYRIIHKIFAKDFCLTICSNPLQRLSQRPNPPEIDWLVSVYSEQDVVSTLANQGPLAK